jgi:hypothetical protein
VHQLSPSAAKEDRERKLSKVRTDSVKGHWKNWDQLVSAESGGAPPSQASKEAIEGARRSAIYAMKKGGRWCRSERLNSRESPANISQTPKARTSPND